MKMSTSRANAAPATRTLTRRTLNGETMGTRYSAVYFASPELDPASLSSAMFDAVTRVDAQMSTWKPNSDLNRLSAAPSGTWVDIPPELMAVLALSLRIERASHGSFDIGVGELVSAWGFGPPAGSVHGKALPPGQGVKRPATSAVLELDAKAGRARHLEPISLDLSGIAKGYGVDEMARVMIAFGIPSWLVGIDGEMRAKGLKPDGTMWAVAHERPDRDAREAMGVLELRDMAVATSGNYRHFRDVGGKTVSHTMNPLTAQPLDNDITSVTVLAPTCTLADAWATAFMVMGVADGMQAARARGLDVLFVLQDGSIHTTL